jgi:hypothetical protein
MELQVDAHDLSCAMGLWQAHGARVQIPVQQWMAERNVSSNLVTAPCISIED